MIYITIGFLTLVFFITLFLKKTHFISLAILGSSIISLILLTISFSKSINEIIGPLFKNNMYTLNLFHETFHANILFALILVLISFSEIINLINSPPKISLDYQRLILLYGIFGGILVSSENVLVLSLSLFVIPIIFYFSKTINFDNLNFSFLFFNILGGTLFIIGLNLLSQGTLFEALIMQNVFDSYFNINEYTSIKDLRLDYTFLITICFFVSIIVTNSLFPLSYCFYKKINSYSASTLLIFAVPNIIFLSLVVKFRTFNPLLLELIEYYALANIVFHSFQTLISKSIKKLVFHTYQLITSFITIGLIHYSNQSFGASIILITISTIIFTCIVFTLSQLELKNIPEHLEYLSEKRLSTPKASLSLTILVMLYALPIGPCFLSIITVLQEVSKTNMPGSFIMPLAFLIPSWIGLYLLYKIFYSDKSIMQTDDISFTDLSPIIPLMIIICLLLFKSTGSVDLLTFFTI
jgi:hypothetical protein